MTSSFLRLFRLASPHNEGGVSCDEHGLRLGSAALLERTVNGQWQSCRISLLNATLGKAYGCPIDFSTRAGGLAAVARALNDNNFVRAKIAAVHLQLPDLPATSGKRSDEEISEIAKVLYESNLLSKDWDSTKHPRWPAGQSDGGRFRPSGIDGEGTAAAPDELSTEDHTTPNTGIGPVPASAHSENVASDMDRWRQCNEKCSRLLERPKPYRSWDINTNDYHKCMARCLDETI